MKLEKEFREKESYFQTNSDSIIYKANMLYHIHKSLLFIDIYLIYK